jgi:hypothetical protein
MSSSPSASPVTNNQRGNFTFDTSSYPLIMFTHANMRDLIAKMSSPPTSASAHSNSDHVGAVECARGVICGGVKLGAKIATYDWESLFEEGCKNSIRTIKRCETVVERITDANGGEIDARDC